MVMHVSLAVENLVETQPWQKNSLEENRINWRASKAAERTSQSFSKQNVPIRKFKQQSYR